VIERAALNPEVDIDKMERLLQMQERVLDRQALMAYSAAMAAMQTELPSIAERGQGNNGAYATLEDIVDTVRPDHAAPRLRGELPYPDPGAWHPGHRRADAPRTVTARRPACCCRPIPAAARTPCRPSAPRPATASATCCARCSTSPPAARTTTVMPRAPVKCVTPFQASQLKQLIRLSVTTQEWFVGKYGEVERVPRSDFDKLRASLQKRALPHQRH
jgi:hypothetical protein